MKLRLISTASFLFGAGLSLAFGQGRPGPRGGERPDPAVMVKHLSERFANIAVYDTNKDAKLDATEQTAVAKAIEDGTLKVGPPGREGEEPKGERPPAADIAGHLSGLYGSIAAYDADKDGKLSETEQATVVAAVKDGSLKLPHRGGPGGPGRGGRGRGERPDGPPPAP